MFLSYANVPGDGQAEAVREFWEFLRSSGVDARLDLPAAEQRQDWALWMGEQIREADYVLIIASPAYRERAEGRSGPADGRGVQWETRLIRDAFYRDRHSLRRFLPVVLPGQTVDGVPDYLAPASTTVYHVSEYTKDGAKPLLRLLTGQPGVVEPPIGPPPDLSAGPTARDRARRRTGTIAAAAALLLATIGLRVALHGSGAPAAAPPGSPTTGARPAGTAAATHATEIGHTDTTLHDGESLRRFDTPAGRPYAWYHGQNRQIALDAAYRGHITVLPDGRAGTVPNCLHAGYPENGGTVTMLRAGQFVCILSSDDRLVTLHVLSTGGDPAGLRVAITEWRG